MTLDPIKNATCGMLFKNPSNEEANHVNSQDLHYSMIIEWSDEDQAFVVSLPEFPGQHTHGDTYEKACAQGRDLIETWVDIYQQDGKPLPQHKIFSSVA